jgi:hypothetical protein
MTDFGLSDGQSQAILDMRWQRLTSRACGLRRSCAECRVELWYSRWWRSVNPISALALRLDEARFGSGRCQPVIDIVYRHRNTLGTRRAGGGGQNSNGELADLSCTKMRTCRDERKVPLALPTLCV